MGISGFVLIIIVLVIEVVIFFAEVLLSAFSRKNRKMANSNFIDEVDFIDLEKGCRTGISVFRISMFIAYVFLVILMIDTSSAKNTIEEFILYILIGILIYMLSLMNLKVFNFYDNYFVVASPFHFFNKDMIIRYDEITDFHLYRALYNAYYLRLKFKDSPDKLIQFASVYLPRNDLIIRIILNTKTGLQKDFRSMPPEEDFS